MNEDNKKFLESFRERTSTFKDFDEQMSKIHNLKCQIEAASDETVKFLNDNVMATATSSLVRTDTILEQVDTNNYRRDDCDEYVTFNHKGLGTIRVKKPGASGYSYGTNNSEPLNPKEFLAIVGSDDMRQKLINDLINNKKTKILKHFNDMCSAKDELTALSQISAEYQKECKGLVQDLNGEQEIFFVKHDQDDDGHYETKLTKFTVQSVQLDDASRIRLHTKEIVEDEPSYDNEYGKKGGMQLRVSDIETAMVFMQFPVELKNALDNMEASVKKDHDEVMRLKHAIEEKLATYSVLKSLM